VSVSFTPVLAEGQCRTCFHNLMQYPQDLEGDLRCGRCGEPHSKAEPKKPATTRRAKTDGI
jgi:hypothetical protein